MGAFTVFIGLKLTWTNLNGSFGQMMKQLFIVLISMSLGKLLGKLFGLQKFSNSIGQHATKKLAEASSPTYRPELRFGHGFIVCTLLSCASPLAVLASVQEGLNSFSPAFVIKSLMDGLAAMSFVSVFNWGVMLSILPLIAYQGTIFLGVKSLEPFLQNNELLSSVNATNGLLIFCVALIILNLKKIELADYLPSLAIAPLITFFWR